MFMLLVEESSRIILHRKPLRHPPCLIKPLGIYYMLTSIAMINWFNATVCYNNMPSIIGLGWVGLGWVGLLNYGCKVYVLYTKIPNIELVILCVLHHTHPKENKALETMGGPRPTQRPQHLGLPIIRYSLCFCLICYYTCINSKKLLVEFLLYYIFNFG